MKVGIGLGSGLDVAERAVEAERLGFDYVFSGEHLFFHGAVPNAFISLAVAAGATDSIGLVSAVTLVALYPAVMVAKMAAWLDDLSGGRFHLGVGVGGEFPAEFAAAGVRLRDRGARTDEALEIVTRLFTGEPVTYDGRWATLEGLALAPPPARHGGPPIWIGGRGEAATRRAGRWGRAWLPYMVTPEQLRAGRDDAGEAAAQAGRAPGSVTAGLFCFVTIDEDGDRARAEAAEVVGGIYRQDFRSRLRYLVAGTPYECAQRLREYGASGADSVHLTIASAPGREGRMRSLLAEAVLPVLRDDPPPPAPAAAAR